MNLNLKKLASTILLSIVSFPSLILGQSAASSINSANITVGQSGSFKSIDLLFVFLSSVSVIVSVLTLATTMILGFGAFAIYRNYKEGQIMYSNSLNEIEVKKKEFELDVQRVKKQREQFEEKFSDIDSTIEKYETLSINEFMNKGLEVALEREEIDVQAIFTTLSQVSENPNVKSYELCLKILDDPRFQSEDTFMQQIREKAKECINKLIHDGKPLT